MADIMTLVPGHGAPRVSASLQPLDDALVPVDRRLVVQDAPDSRSAAQYRVRRHRITAAGDPRVLVVTSAVAREGKSTCAANLALAMSEDGRERVLLLEANRRAPSLARLFGIKPSSCFARQMERHHAARLTAWSMVEVCSGLHVAAMVPPAPSERLHLDGAAFAEALTALRRTSYQHLIIDAPPVLGSADVNLIEQLSDAVLFTVLRTKTSGARLARAIDQLRPTRLLGMALLDT